RPVRAERPDQRARPGVHGRCQRHAHDGDGRRDDGRGRTRLRRRCAPAAPVRSGRLPAASQAGEDGPVSFDATIDQRIELLRSVWLFSSCTDDELGRIGALTRPREYAAGNAVTVQGEEGDEFFVVVEGEASALVDGDEVGTIVAGGFFGEMALLDGA